MFVSFDPTSYIVTEGEDGFAELTLVRSGDTSRATVVTVTPTPGSAEGMPLNVIFDSSQLATAPFF